MTGSTTGSVDPETERVNDRLAAQHPINAYYDESPALIRWIERRRLQVIREMTGSVRNARILEIGSGGGHVLRMFPEARLVAVDVSDNFLATARQNLAGYDVEFIKGEIDKLGLPARSFDRIICTEVLEHTKSPGAILAEIARLLKPDGRAVITVPNDPLINRLKWLVRRTPVGWYLGDRVQWGGDVYHLHQWRPREFHALAGRYFDVQRTVCVPFEAAPLRVCLSCHCKTP